MVSLVVWQAVLPSKIHTHAHLYTYMLLTHVNDELQAYMRDAGTIHRILSHTYVHVYKCIHT